MWIISFPICLETHYILTLWLGEYPQHTGNFLHLIVVLCLIQTLKTPRSTVFHATGHLKLVNIVVGSILCSAFPLAYIFLKLGGSPESVFWAANITMLLSEIASIFILKRYVAYSLTDYLLKVHIRCLIVTAVSFTGLLTTFSVAITSLYVGMNRDVRHNLLNLITNKIRK